MLNDRDYTSSELGHILDVWFDGEAPSYARQHANDALDGVEREKFFGSLESRWLV